MDDVVRYGTRFGIGDMLELIRIGHVAERPDSGHVRAQVFIGDDVSGAVGVDAGRAEIQRVAVWGATDRNQQRIARGNDQRQRQQDQRVAAGVPDVGQSLGKGLAARTWHVTYPQSWLYRPAVASPSSAAMAGTAPHPALR